MMQQFAPLIYQMLSDLPNLDAEQLKNLQRAFAKEHQMTTLPSKSQLLQTYFSLVNQNKIEKNTELEHLLKKRAIRSMSGIVSVQVLTKPRPCP
jgi:histone acetyltransferase (RNA polymerase elongator complex component)